MDFHHIHMFQPSVTKGYLLASCTKVLGDNSLMISQFGNISTGTSIPGKQRQQTWTSSFATIKGSHRDFWGFSPAETSTMWAWLSLAAQCSSLTICILQPFATHGKITLTSAKMSMHSNSHDIQQKYDDCVPMAAWLSHNKHYKNLNHTLHHEL